MTAIAILFILALAFPYIAITAYYFFYTRHIDKQIAILKKESDKIDEDIKRIRGF